MLSVLGGFLAPVQRQMKIGSQTMRIVAPAKWPATKMFPDYGLIRHMILRNNLGFGLRMAVMLRHKRHKKTVEKTVEKIGYGRVGQSRPETPARAFQRPTPARGSGSGIGR